MSMGTQPMPPSDRAMARSGKRSGTPDHSHSAAAMRALTGNRVGRSSKGGSGEGRGAHDDAPVCRQTTVAVSSQAAKRGSQWPLKIDGSPSWEGNSGKLTARKPSSALRADLGRRHLDVGQPRQLEGDDPAPGRCRPRPRGASGSTPATQARPSSGSPDREKTDPQNPATSEGKQSEAQIPAVSMSATRASMS